MLQRRSIRLPIAFRIETGALDRRCAARASLAICVVLAACLVTVGCRSHQPAGPQALLDHFYVVVDSATFEAAAANAFMRERFAGFSRDSTAVGEGQSWVGLYWFGRNTYIELLRESADRSAGAVGIGLSIDRAGDLEDLAVELSTAGYRDYETGLMTKTSGADEVPWLYWLECERRVQGQEFACWVQAYHEDYLQREFSGLSSERGRLTRGEYLSRYHDPSRRLDDVVELTLALYPDQAETFLNLLSVCGYAIETADDVHVADGGGVTFRLVTARGKMSGLVEARMTTTRPGPADVSSLDLGTTTLVLHRGGGATWRFGLAP